MERMRNKDLENAWAVQWIRQEKCAKLEEENKKLKERIEVLYEFIERNDKLVDEVIENEDLDKLNWYIYIDDDLVDRTLESEE